MKTKEEIEEKIEKLEYLLEREEDPAICYDYTQEISILEWVIGTWEL